MDIRSSEDDESDGISFAFLETVIHKGLMPTTPPFIPKCFHTMITNEDSEASKSKNQMNLPSNSFLHTFSSVWLWFPHCALRILYRAESCRSTLSRKVRISAVNDGWDATTVQCLDLFQKETKCCIGWRKRFFADGKTFKMIHAGNWQC